MFQIAAGTTASISGITISGGSALASGNQTGLGGGVDNFGTLSLSAVAISGNSAIDGGGLANEGKAQASLTNSTVSSNTGTTGGGIYNAGTLSLSNSTIAGNFASSQGGGVSKLQHAHRGQYDDRPEQLRRHRGRHSKHRRDGQLLYNTIVSQNTIGSTVSPATFAAGCRGERSRRPAQII